MKKLLLFVLLVLFIAGCYTHFTYTKLASEAHKHYDNLELGVPCPSDLVIDREGYALGYSTRNSQPLWVTYRLTDFEVTNRVCKRFGFFLPDPTVKEHFYVGASPEDYFRTGYDRGHMAPAADMHWSTNAMLESFYMANISPQTASLNRNTWAMAEAFARECAVKEGSVFIVTGPICTNDNPKTIGIGNVVVPDAFYKIIYDETPPEKMIAFVMPNDKPNANMWLYATNVACVEELTGMRFFPNLETNKTHLLKMQVNTNEWISINEKDSSTSLTNGVPTVTGGYGGISQSGE